MNQSLETLHARVSHPDAGFDFIRVFLGIALFVRGVLFVAQPYRLFAMVPTGNWFMPALLGHYVGIAHVCGGMLLAVGLATRLAAVIQIPVLVGAVFFVHWRDGLLSQGQSLELAVLVLAMLVAYSVFGAGRYSLDALVHRPQPSTERDAKQHPRLTRRYV